MKKGNTILFIFIAILVLVVIFYVTSRAKYIPNISGTPSPVTNETA